MIYIAQTIGIIGRGLTEIAYAAAGRIRFRHHRQCLAHADPAARAASRRSSTPIRPPSSSSIPALAILRKQTLADLMPSAFARCSSWSPRRGERNASAAERDIDLSTPAPWRTHRRCHRDAACPNRKAPCCSTLQERSLAQRMDRQLMARGAVRSMHGMAAVLAHEIKNPLAGIRGAAQLLEEALAPGRARDDPADHRRKPTASAA